MNLQLSDREKQIILTALEHLKTVKLAQVGTKVYVQLNEYDIISQQHTVMHTVKLLARITARPIEHFMNPLQDITPKEPVIAEDKPEPE